MGDYIDSVVQSIIGWQPSNREALRIPVHRSGRLATRVLEVVVGQLNNGLLYATVQTPEGQEFKAMASYNIEDVGLLPGGFRLINLKTHLDDGRPVYSATFQYKAGKTPDGRDDTVLEYTMGHCLGGQGLTKLRSLYAHQEVSDGRIDVSINEAAKDFLDPSVTATLSASDGIFAELNFNGDGKLLRSPAVFISPEHPFYQIHKKASEGELVDPLSTAIVLIKGFPSQRPLHIEQLVQYQPQTHQQRLL